MINIAKIFTFLKSVHHIGKLFFYFFFNAPEGSDKIFLNYLQLVTVRKLIALASKIIRRCYYSSFRKSHTLGVFDDQTDTCNIPRRKTLWLHVV